MTVIKSSRLGHAVVACALGLMVAALGLGQTAGMPPLPPLKGTPAVVAPADPAHFTFVVAGDNRPATEMSTLTATIVDRPIYAQRKSSRLVKSCRDQLETLFAKYSNLRFVLASHEHLFYQPAKLDHPAPPSYLVSGGAGAPLAKGGFYNCLVFTVDGGQVTWNMVKPGGAAAPVR